jgi:hypothetical protein
MARAAFGKPRCSPYNVRSDVLRAGKNQRNFRGIDDGDGAEARFGH